MSKHDVVIIGGGAAGLSAALVLCRARRDVLVIDAGTPRNAPAAHMHGFLSRDGLAPQELLAVGRSEVEHYGGRVVDGTVAGIRRVDAGFEVVLSDESVTSARRVIVTTGLRDELPQIPGVRERWGRDLLHCPYCHGYEVRDQPLGVLGASVEAVQHALLIRQWSHDIVVFSHTDVVTAEAREQLTARAIGLVEGPVKRLVVERDRLTGVELEDGRVVPRTAVFVRPRFVPNTQLLVDAGCATDNAGWVAVDPAGRTSEPGLWAAGNATDPRAQVITAAGQGSATAIALNADLIDEDVHAALLDFRGALPLSPL